MRKIIQLALIGIILIFIGCKKDANKNEINPLLFLGQCQGDSTLNLNVTYTGPTTATTGTGRIFVYLYNSLGPTTRDPKPLYTGSTPAPVALSAKQSITISGICSGDYYVLVFYDLNGGGNFDNQQDPYILYTNTPYPAAASKVNISGDVTLPDITFDDTKILQAQSTFLTTTTYTVTIKATYTGAEALPASTASKRLYVFLYNASLGTSTTNPALPANSASTTAEIVPGAKYTIPVTGVLTGTYYALVFYDSVKGTSTDSQDDPYTFFAGTPYTANAQAIIVSADMTLPDFTFGDTNLLLADSVYNSGATTYTLTVNAEYTGALPGGAVNRPIYVYLYGALGTGTRNQYTKIYQGVSDNVTATPQSKAITVSNVIPGDYYILVFYNYATGGTADNAGDMYRLYDNAVPAGITCPTLADKYTISGDATINGISIDDTIPLGASSMFDTSTCP